MSLFIIMYSLFKFRMRSTCWVIRFLLRQASLRAERLGRKVMR